MEKEVKNVKLRNFQMDNEVYYDLELLAKENNRNCKDQLSSMIRQARDKYLKDKGLTVMPRTERRMEKLSAGKK